jgi:branched-chain amino acid transport system ATP-binding protein
MGHRMTSAAILRMDDVHTYYGASHTLQGVSLFVAEGELVCLLGRNGVGKSTTIGSIIGFNRPRRGRIIFRGTDITGKPPHRIAAGGIGLVPQGRRIFRDLTVLENLTMVASERRGPWNPRKVFEVFPRLEERQSNMGDQLSGGEQQMLAIGRALLMNPSLLLMDEPSEGLAPLVVADIARVIRELKEQGMSGLLVEQNLAFALPVADRCYVLSKGRIVHESTPDALMRNEDVTRQYLGV